MTITSKGREEAWDRLSLEQMLEDGTLKWKHNEHSVFELIFQKV